MIKRKYLPGAILGLLLLAACASPDKFRWDKVPTYTEQSYWLSRQYALDYQTEDLSATYVTRIGEITPTHYHLAVSLKDQPQVAYTIRIRRTDLAIDGFISAREKELEVDLPLLSFPLFKGKAWTETLRMQEHPRTGVKEIPASFVVKGVVEYDYLPNEKLPQEKKAFLIEMTLPNKTITYHYIPPSKNFPGTNLVDLYLQMDVIYANTPQLRSELLEYVK